MLAFSIRLCESSSVLQLNSGDDDPPAILLSLKVPMDGFTDRPIAAETTRILCEKGGCFCPKENARRPVPYKDSSISLRTEIPVLEVSATDSSAASCVSTPASRPVLAIPMSVLYPYEKDIYFTYYYIFYREPSPPAADLHR